jgi:hypothetical protein
MACCAAKGACATGACDRVGATGAPSAPSVAADAPSKSRAPKLAASCTGPAPATTADDRDPMVPDAAAALPIAAARGESPPIGVVVGPTRDDSPSVPPPRA